ncbi:MAG: hypothetical protein JXR97_12055 [Planctomycetes bacterium]|nr:hypothetical protein [Planctomycetota bacterium]
MKNHTQVKLLSVALMAVVMTAISMIWLPARSKAEVEKRYGEIPKGVVLEGVGKGLPEIKSIEWNAEQEAFVINGDSIYTCPIDAAYWLDMESALEKDDLMGMSLLDKTTARTYGKLNTRHKVIKALEDADLLLGSVTFAWMDVLGDRKLPGNYKPKQPEGKAMRMACIYAMDHFKFSSAEVKDKEKAGKKPLPANIKNRISCADRSLSITLFPILSDKSRSGGHLPDYDAINAGTEQKEYRENADHIRSHLDEYMKTPEVSTALDYGESAAFIRYLRDSKIDISALRKQMKVYLKTRKRR